jgi:hypothetical protein
VELSSLRQLACLSAPPYEFWLYHKPNVCKKRDSQQVCFSVLFYFFLSTLGNTCKCPFCANNE